MTHTSPEQIKTWLRYFDGAPPALRIVEQDRFVALLIANLQAAEAPIPFWPLPDGTGWHVAGNDHRGRLPVRGLRLAWEAIRAAQANAAPPTITDTYKARHAARKAIKTNATRWARAHCPEFVPVLWAVSIERGQVLYDRQPGVPKVACVPGA